MTQGWEISYLRVGSAGRTFPMMVAPESKDKTRIKSVGDDRVTTPPRHDQCFPPITGNAPHTLVLGSLPGQRSLQEQRYYAHPQNAFWKIVLTVFDAPSTLPYTQRVKILTDHGVALWDVLAAAERPGSLDSSIVHASARTNDFAGFFRAHPHIRRVFFNGKKAEELYRRFVLPELGTEFQELRYQCMPSTSPAHAGMTFAKKLEHWIQIRS